ncbi:MAG TPA: DinB family protein [Caldithrix abyssi]|uniref:DinB family protein n=1 Tax=Caldithrix abyssi TaxID=187145 RepID=A0A7V1LJZ4_CALAY|nr:DinB family protein [Caldithrix abyssi]
MNLNDLKHLFRRDIDRLQKEIEAYEQESLLWLVRGEISNSAGNLCLHLCGNLRHYIGHVLGGSGYVRDRAHEFSARDMDRRQLTAEIDDTRRAVEGTLEKLAEEELDKTYPEEVLGYEMSTGYFLIHLYGHLNYHLGQINYHRRLSGKSGR